MIPLYEAADKIESIPGQLLNMRARLNNDPTYTASTFDEQLLALINDLREFGNKFREMQETIAPYPED